MVEEEVEEMKEEKKEEGSKERKRAETWYRDTCISLSPPSVSSFSPSSFFFLPALPATFSPFLVCALEREPNQVRLYVHFMTYGQWRGRVCEVKKAQ